MDSAWLVFGVRNKTRVVVGTDYRTEPKRLDLTKRQVYEGTRPSIALRGIRAIDHPSGRLVVFEIPPAPQGMPISWKGHFYSRAGENLMPLSMDKLDAIRAEESLFDWTAQAVSRRRGLRPLIRRPVRGEKSLQRAQWPAHSPRDDRLVV
jgi:ATP-dependent DNA helicase RecG